jgi:hypothetical protein
MGWVDPFGYFNNPVECLVSTMKLFTLKIRGIKKGTIRPNKFKNSRKNFRYPKRLNSSPKNQGKRRIHKNAQKLKFLRKELNVKALEIQIEKLFQT